MQSPDSQGRRSPGGAPWRTGFRIVALAWALGGWSRPPAAHAASPWPAETGAQALKLTALDADFTHDMSGASWNPSNRTFWVCCNSPGTFWALQQNTAGTWMIATNAAGTPARWAPGRDLEGICQADYTKPLVYVMDEGGYIREYDVSAYGTVKQTRVWDIRAYCPEVDGSGPEAITFVPDDWLRRSDFRHGNGEPCVSTNGMGGLMFVGSQIGGHVHVFDLTAGANTFAYVGSNQTSRAETAGLEFDRATGKLHIWHNIGANYLEVAELGSTVTSGIRKFRTLIEYTGPRSGNLEGIAIASSPDGDDLCLITDDNNDSGEGITLYRQFRPVEDTDTDRLTDTWELLHFGSVTLTNGATDADADGHTDQQEFRAGTDPRDSASILRIESVVAQGVDLAIRWRTAGGRTNVVQVAAALGGVFEDCSPPLLIPGAGDTPAEYLSAGAATNALPRFYRVRLSP